MKFTARESVGQGLGRGLWQRLGQTLRSSCTRVDTSSHARSHGGSRLWTPIVVSGAIGISFPVLAGGAQEAAERPATTPISATPAEGTATASTEAERSLTILLDEYDGWRLYEFPELARDRGLAIRTDAITVVGSRTEAIRHAQLKIFQDDLKAIPRAGLSDRAAIDYDLFAMLLDAAIMRFERGVYLFAIGPLHGPQQSVPRMAERTRFDSADDYEMYLRRLSWVPQNLRDTIGMLREGLERGLVPAKIAMQAVPGQFEGALRTGLTRLRDPFERFPATIAKERQDELRRQFDEQALPAISEAMAELAAFVQHEYIPACRDSVGISHLPDGEALYRFQLAVETTTTLSPAEIHAIGLDEVARIRGEMLHVIRRTDWFLKDPTRASTDDDALLAQFIQYLRTDQRFYHRDAESLLSSYRDICKRIDAHLPGLFGQLPRLPYGVRAIPAFIAPAQTTAYYEPGSLASGEPGWFAANTYALDQRPTYEMIPLSLHEAVPGHHLQISLAKENVDVHPFRRDAEFTAFVEGWALYAERLGIEMGLYANPYDDFGRLLYEMWRSCRLVVDTGLHALGWTRDEAIAYMTKYTALSELNIKNEVDRYIHWPGQACAYKLGERAIRSLRAKAESMLGPAFRLRAFHDELLRDGPLPLPVLEAKMTRWMERVRDTAPQATQ